MIRIHAADDPERRADIADQLAQVLDEVHRRIHVTHPFLVSDVCQEWNIDFAPRESA